jgi:hypothetical protein
VTYEPPKSTVHVSLSVRDTTPAPTSCTAADKPYFAIRFGDFPAEVEMIGTPEAVWRQLRAALDIVEARLGIAVCTHCGGPYHDGTKSVPHLNVCPLVVQPPMSHPSATPVPYRDVADAEYATDRVALS